MAVAISGQSAARDILNGKREINGAANSQPLRPGPVGREAVFRCKCMSQRHRAAFPSARRLDLDGKRTDAIGPPMFLDGQELSVMVRT